MADRIVCLRSRVSSLESPFREVLAWLSAHGEHVACISLGLNKTNDQFEGFENREKRQKGQMDK